MDGESCGQGNLRLLTQVDLKTNLWTGQLVESDASRAAGLCPGIAQSSTEQLPRAISLIKGP